MGNWCRAMCPERCEVLMYHISIYFDEKTDARIREYMRTVAEVTGNAYMMEGDVPPHITLAAFECEQEWEKVQQLKMLIGNVAGKLKTGTLRWVSIGTFQSGVIFLQPVLSEYLQDMIQQVHECLQQVEGVKIRPYYCPYSWLPHSTVAKRLKPAQLLQAFEVLQREFCAFEGKTGRIGLAKMNPHREIAGWRIC